MIKEREQGKRKWEREKERLRELGRPIAVDSRREEEYEEEEEEYWEEEELTLEERMKHFYCEVSMLSGWPGTIIQIFKLFE